MNEAYDPSQPVETTQPEMEFPQAAEQPFPEEPTFAEAAEPFQWTQSEAQQSSAPGKPQRKPARQRAPGTRRRVALIAATLYIPIIFVSYALYMYSPSECVLGPFCSSDTITHMPLLLIIGGTVFGLALLYALTVWPLTIALDESQPTTNDISRLLRQAARFESVRPLLMGFAALVLLLLIYGVFFAHALPWPGVLIGLAVTTLLFILSVTG